MKNVKQIYETPVVEVVNLDLESALLQTSGTTDGISSNSLDSFLFGGDAFGNN